MVEKDPFGIPIKYQRVSLGQQYFLSSGIVNRKGINNEWDGGRIIVEEGGDIVHADRVDFYNMTKSDAVRISVTTTDGYQSSKILLDREQRIKKGFMQTSKDFGNVEITFSFIYNGSGNDDCFVYLSARGAKHRDDRQCEGCSYGARLFLKTPNVTQLVKETVKGYYPTNSKRNGLNSALSVIQGREVFVKLCIFDLDDQLQPTTTKSEATFVKIELYAGLETAVGSGEFKFTKLLQSTTDTGGWSKGGDQCGSASTTRLIWDAPIVSIGWEGFPNIDFRNLSVVEIDAGAIKQTSPEIGTEIPPQENPTPSPTSSEPLNDSLGVKKIYKTAKDGTVLEPPLESLLNDDRYSSNGAKVTAKGGGIYQVEPGTTRILFYSTSSAKSRDEPDTFDDYPTHDFEELRKKGSWDDPKTDFHNIEFTVYLKHIKASNPDNDEFSLACRSVRHESTSNKGCGGSSYHGNINLDGKFRFKKEQYHVNYNSLAYTTSGIGNITGKMFGMKFICYDIMDGKAVKLEIWCDKDNNNSWKKYHELVDQDDWGDAMKFCGALKDGAAILWGSPKDILKCNNQQFQFTKPSVRNIEAKLLTPIPGTGGGSTGNLARQTAEFIFMWDHILDVSGTNCAGGGAPPPTPHTYTEKYGVTEVTDWKQVSANFPAEDDRKRVMEVVKNTSSKLYHIIPTKLGLLLRKHGSPTGTGFFEVYDNNRPTPNKVGTFGTIDVSTLGTSGAEVFKTNDDMANDVPNGLGTNWGVGFRYEGGDSSNYVEVGVNYDAPFDSGNTIEAQFEKEGGGSYVVAEHSDRDIAGHIYKSP